ncbi:hypothetical protein OESDEN_23302 [Oesophagostomum dentatum]|uniref:Uncharacterized protein n=1 Tax=Oesophagostomum dentatum TaxID=61180 RepID=A0A0B1RVF3_OESDE|nr:hypothetical protein OESDEN_23302 [Oesophagostomum dentatum]
MFSTEISDYGECASPSQVSDLAELNCPAYYGNLVCFIWHQLILVAFLCQRQTIAVFFIDLLPVNVGMKNVNPFADDGLRLDGG